MGLVLLLSGGGNVAITGSDGITASDALTARSVTADSDAATATDASGNRSFTVTETVTGTEAATGGAPSNVNVPGTELFSATEALDELAVAYADRISITESATVGRPVADITDDDAIFVGESAFVTDASTSGVGGLFNETIRRDRELWNRRFQPGRPV
jgi:hypothetical protein